MRLGAAMIVRGGIDVTKIMLNLDAILPREASVRICEDGRFGEIHTQYIPGLDVQVNRDAFELWTSTCPHFAANRNRSIDLCPADWIVWLDADETIHGPLLPAVEEADQAAANALFLPVREHVGGKYTRTFAQLRAFRKGAVRFQFPVHNEPLWLWDRKARFEDAVHVDTHYPADPAARHPRTYPALLKLWREGDPHPTDGREAELAHAAYFLAKLSLQRGRWGAVRKWADRCLEASETIRRGHANAWLWSALGYMNAYGWEASFRRTKELLPWAPWNADLWHHLARLSLMRWYETIATASPIENYATAGYLERAQEAFDLLGMGIGQKETP